MLAPGWGGLAEVPLQQRKREGGLHALSARLGFGLGRRLRGRLRGFFFHNEAEPLLGGRGGGGWAGRGRDFLGLGLELVGGGLELLLAHPPLRPDDLVNPRGDPRADLLSRPDSRPDGRATTDEGQTQAEDSEIEAPTIHPFTP
ncbi:MAG: hypothetical protein ACE5EL_06605, partial [Anaerolineae bacterium]